MKKYLFLATALIFALHVNAQTEPANYNTVINKFKLFYNTNQPDSIYKIFGTEMKKALSPDQFKATVTQLRTQLGDLEQTTLSNYTKPIALYKAVFKNGPLSLNLVLSDNNLIAGLLLQPYKQPAATPAVDTAPAPLDPSLAESTVSLKTLSGTLYGTLTMPKDASGKIPVVLIIPGSGPTDRNGNSLKMGLDGNTYKLLAEEMGKKGIASLRYDKRMVGESTTSMKEVDLRFEDYVDDAIGLIQLLNDDQRFSKVIVLGHSEGSLVGMIAAHDQPAKAFISVAGAGEPAEKIITEQLKSQPQYIQDEFKSFIDSLKKGKTTDRIDPALYAIARPSIQLYMMSWCRYNPQKVIRALRIPILIIQGTNDIQITVADAEKLKKAKSDATLKIITGMNHILKEAPADREQNIATYSNPNLPLKPELVTDIVDFIGKVQ